MVQQAAAPSDIKPSTSWCGLADRGRLRCIVVSNRPARCEGIWPDTSSLLGDASRGYVPSRGVLARRKHLLPLGEISWYGLAKQVTITCVLADYLSGRMLQDSTGHKLFDFFVQRRNTTSGFPRSGFVRSLARPRLARLGASSSHSAVGLGRAGFSWVCFAAEPGQMFRPLAGHRFMVRYGTFCHGNPCQNDSRRSSGREM